MNKLGAICSVFLLFAVAMGAFAAHGLKAILSDAQLTTIKTAVLYQFIHAIGGLVVVALAYLDAFKDVKNWLRRAAFSFILGCVLFSGSLYGLVLTGLGWLGPITPIGGVAFIIGWGFLCVAFLRSHSVD